MNNIKIVTKISLALEAERALKNIFIKKEVVKQEIKEKGNFRCPEIMFRF